MEAYVDQLVVEPAAVEAARIRGAELGCDNVSPTVGSVLRLLASTINARTVVEIGTGTGVSGAWLLDGAAVDAVLTSIDSDHARQRAAREAFDAAGIGAGRVRLIAGHAEEVLPRLQSGAYDMVFVDTAIEFAAAILDDALSLLRPGGVIAICHTLDEGKVADPAERDVSTNTARELANRLTRDESLVASHIPVGTGLLVAMVSATRLEA